MKDWSIDTKNSILVEMYVTPKNKKEYDKQKKMYKQMLNILKKHKYKFHGDHINSYAHNGTFFFIIDKKQRLCIRCSSITMVCGFEWKRINIAHFIKFEPIFNNF